MFKNCPFKPSVDTVKWLKSAGKRAVRTACQTALGLITVGQAVTDIDWVGIISVTATAAIISILTSLTGLPEAESEETDGE